MVITAGNSESGITEKGNLGGHSKFQSPFSPADLCTGISVVKLLFIICLFFFYLALIRAPNRKN